MLVIFSENNDLTFHVNQTTAVLISALIVKVLANNEYTPLMKEVSNLNVYATLNHFQTWLWTIPCIVSYMLQLV